MDALKDFFNEEIRCGYTVSRKMKQVWACQLDLLERFSEVCHRHGFKFWLDSGTLLGAVRHKGYIPWDDDIDVIMFRDDYDRLSSIAQNEFKDPYIFQTAYTERNFVRGHAQLRNSRTSAILPVEIHKNFNQGIFIDIFVMDNVPYGEDNERALRRRSFRLRHRLELRALPMKCMTSRHETLQALKYRLKYPTRNSFRKLYGRYEDLFRSIQPHPEGTVACIAWNSKCFRRDRKLYEETVYMDFEHLKMPVPKEYDKLLKTLYGDYMVPVKAPTCHGEVIFDPDTPADEKIRQLRKNE